MEISETKTRMIAEEINSRMAHVFQREPISFSLVFVPLIRQTTRRLKDGSIETEVVHGRVDVDSKVIEIVPDERWGLTLIEELIHLYYPDMRHREVKALAKKLGRYFKAVLNNKIAKTCLQKTR